MEKMTHMSMARTTRNHSDGQLIISEIVVKLPENLTFIEEEMNENQFEQWIEKLMHHCTVNYDQGWIPMAFMTQNGADDTLNFK